jgi:ribosomal protein S27E
MCRLRAPVSATRGVMTMVQCPYCKRTAMTLWRKAALGPGRAVNCQSCGKKVAVHWTAVFAAIPAFLGGYVLMKSGSSLLGFGAVAGGILLMGMLHTFLIPLVRNDV